jgi:hypothetical protein
MMMLSVSPATNFNAFQKFPLSFDREPIDKTGTTRDRTIADEGDTEATLHAMAAKILHYGS